jgi:hypothetical protein
MTPPAGLLSGLRCFSRVAALWFIYASSQCGRVLLLLFKRLLMISGTDCGQCGEMLRDWTHRTQSASWQHSDQPLFAVPFYTTCLPRHLHLVLSRHHDVLRNVSCFRLRVHTFNPEAAGLVINFSQRGLSEAQNGYGFGMLLGYGSPNLHV